MPKPIEVAFILCAASITKGRETRRMSDAYRYQHLGIMVEKLDTGAHGTRRHITMGGSVEASNSNGVSPSTRIDWIHVHSGCSVRGCKRLGSE